jgi:DNA invertase Pin-like site-specific DNA recombinase
MGFLWPKEVGSSIVNQPVKRKLRCAIYTRKSSEEGLEMEFNSLDAQRAACAAYIQSQKGEGWVQVDTHFDDGGFSGGNLVRPAVQKLMSAIEAGLINCVIVYKIDRISRSLSDFSRLMETFDAHGVKFVSVTQSFDTLTAMGKLTLNILLSFGQFERELTGERIRDKFLASRKRGIFMGGVVPFGYLVKERKLVVRNDEAKIVEMIFDRFIRLGSATALAQQLAIEGVLTRSGKKFDKGVIYKLLSNRVYIGLAVHKEEAYPGEHKAIIPQDTWEKVRAILSTNSRQRAAQTRRKTPALLKGLIFGPDGAAMSPTHTKRRGKLYRYYVSQTVLKGGAKDAPVPRVPAGQIEDAVRHKLRSLLQSPEILVGASRIARQKLKDTTEADIRSAVSALDHVWDELFPAEQARVFQLLVARITVDPEGIDVQLRADGLARVSHEISERNAAAA